MFDARLREISKGARQEFPKAWDYERAVQERQQLGVNIPPLETSDDAWKRIADFIASVLEDATTAETLVQESTAITTQNYQTPPPPPPPSTTIDQKQKEQVSSSVVRNVLVVSHAGTLRTLLTKMAQGAHPALLHNDDPSRPPNENERLAVPNTSVTILDVTTKQPMFDEMLYRCRTPHTIYPPPTHSQSRNARQEPDGNRFFPGPSQERGNSNDEGEIDHHHHHHRLDLLRTKYNELWSTRVVEFMWTDHLMGLGNTSNDG
jgi:broad specificity phosphatase PhoE